jgi:hypothetical protein
MYIMGHASCQHGDVRWVWSAQPVEAWLPTATDAARPTPTGQHERSPERSRDRAAGWLRRKQRLRLHGEGIPISLLRLTQDVPVEILQGGVISVSILHGYLPSPCRYPCWAATLQGALRVRVCRWSRSRRPSESVASTPATRWVPPRAALRVPRRRLLGLPQVGGCAVGASCVQRALPLKPSGWFATWVLDLATLVPVLLIIGQVPAS